MDNEKIEAFKNVWNTLIAIGWNPYPTLIAIAVMIVGRLWLEPDVLEVNTPEAKKRMGLIKFWIVIATLVISCLAHIAVTRPKDAYDVIMSICMSFAHTAVAYFAYSIFAAVNPVGIVVGMIKRVTGQQEPPR